MSEAPIQVNAGLESQPVMAYRRMLEVQARQL